MIAWLSVTAIGAWLAFAVGLQEYVGLLIPATWILSPFVYLQTSAITRDRPLLFWLPGWPGIAAIVVSITAMAVVYGTDIVLWQVGKLAIPEGLSWTLAIVLGLLTLVVEMFLTAYALLAWRHRWRWSQLAGEFRFARLAPCARVLAAVDLQLAWIAALLFVPLLLGGPEMIEKLAVSHIEHAVQVERLHSTRLPFYLSALMGMSRFFVSYWWIATIVAWGSMRYWIPFASEARALHLAETTEDSSHA